MQHIKSFGEFIDESLVKTAIVDNGGNPLIVYRAQNDDRSQGLERQSGHRGIYFSANRDSVKIYGKHVRAYNLDIQNPIILRDSEWNLSVIPEHYYNHLIRQGYDGAVWLRNGEMYEIVAFYPKQVHPLSNF